MQAIWDMRSTGAGNIVASLSLIVSYYLIPFVAGFCVVAFPTKMSVNRTYVKFQLTVIFFIITSAWMDPVRCALHSSMTLSRGSVHVYIHHTCIFIYARR